MIKIQLCLYRCKKMFIRRSSVITYQYIWEWPLSWRSNWSTHYVTVHVHRQEDKTKNTSTSCVVIQRNIPQVTSTIVQRAEFGSMKTEKKAISRKFIAQLLSEAFSWPFKVTKSSNSPSILSSDHHLERGSHICSHHHNGGAHLRNSRRPCW